MDNNPAQKIHGGISLLPPPDLSPKQIELSNKLNDFYQKNNFKPLRPKPSEIFIGAIYGMQDPLRSNPDWIAQVANSLRELLYPIWYEVRREQNKPMEITNKFKRLGYGFIEDVFSELEEVYGKLNDLAHHGLEPKKFTEAELNNFSANDFEKLVSRFENLMFQAFTLPIRQIMNQIDQLVSKTPAEQEDQKALEQEVRSLIREKSAKEYFYYKAHERWLDWFWQNGFLDVIKEKAEDLTGYGYRIPELEYLVRMAEKAPAKVVNIMLAVPISSETFNPEVIDRFSYICSTLPEDQLARMVQKIRDERWIPLMDAFEHWGSDCEDMFKTLDDAKDYESLLVLAEAVLSVRIKDESEKAHSGSLADTPFYFNYLSYVKVFEYLLNVGDEYREQAFSLATRVMADVVALRNKESDLSDQGQLQQLAEREIGHDEQEREKVFKVDDSSLLLDVDFFDLEPGQEDCLSSEDDMRELVAAIKGLAQKLIGDRCDKPEAIRDVYIRYVGDFDNPDAKLPDSPTMWRLRLFVLSLYPEAFKDELKKAFFRLFEFEQYDEITRGTEYKKALQKGFAALPEKDKRHYVKRVMEYFTQQGRDRDAEEKNWHICSGSRILSMIANQLTKEEKGQAAEAGFTLDPNYQPEPSIGVLQVGSVGPRGPITEEEFGQLSIAQIAEKLRHEWKPDNLTQQNTSDDFLSPRNADGVGQLLKGDLPKRLQEYVNNADNFFERGVLDEHYTYSFLHGIQETIQAHFETASKVHWDGVLELCMAIKASGERNSFERDKKDRNAFDPWLAGCWLAGWGEVHFAMTGIFQALLTEKNGLVPIDFGEYRDRIFSIVRYLLSHPDPSPEDEQTETAKCKIDEGFYDTESVPANDTDYTVNDPRHMAVSAVRGQAFKTFALFVYRDGKKFKNEDVVKIADDVKELYESVLEKETTRALMFMFGHSLPFYYSRDRDWIGSLLPQIFPQEPAEKYLYTAAWEGYLSNNLFANNLYEEMFFDPEIQKLYERGLALTDTDYPPQQEHFKKPDEGIAEHLAFAFIHYENLGFDHPLFKTFWKENNPERHANFVNFLGRSFVSGYNASAHELLEKEPESKKRLKEFWDWLLENYENPKPFIQFDFWITLENGIFEHAWLAERVRKTLEKTNGALEADYKLTKSIVRLAQANPEDTLKIAQWYLLEGGVRCNKPRRFSYVNVENEWKEAFKILHGNSETKSETSALINKLIQEGGKPFWDLKEIVDKNGKSPT